MLKTISAVTFLGLFTINILSVGIDNFSHIKELERPDEIHDWECKYIIVDEYTVSGETRYHYTDEIYYESSGAIKFIADDGLITTIPYPYYKLEENISKNKRYN